MLGRLVLVCINLCFGTCAPGQGLPDLTFQNIDIWPIAKDGNTLRVPVEDENGFLWIGSTMGLYRWDGHAMKGYFHSTDTNSINENNITSIYKDLNGDLWVGTSEGGLNKYVPELDHFERRIPANNELGGIGRTVYLTKDGDAHIHWLPTGKGLFRYVEETNTYTSHKVTTPARDVRGYGFRYVIPDKVDPDLLWTGGLDGFYRFRISSNTFEYVEMPIARGLPSGHFMVHDLYFLNDTTLIGGSWGGGVLSYAVRSGDWKQYQEDLSRQDGVRWLGVVFSILPHDSQTLWVGTGQGFGQLDLSTGTYSYYQSDRDHPFAIDSSFWFATFCKTRQQNFVVTRTNGISISSSLTPDSMVLPYNPLISEIVIDGVPHQSDSAIHSLRSLKMEGAQQDVAIALITPGNYATIPVTFMYKMAGYDRDWQTLDEGRTVRYTNLPGGSFDFQFRASLDGNNWRDGPTLRVERQIYFWKTTWFLIGCIALGLGIIGLIYWLNLRSVKREAALKSEFNQRLAEVELQALRAQMNPHFMFNSLNAIKHFILTHEPLKASEYLTNFATLIRSILHNSREKLIPVSKELEALMLYTELEQLRFQGKFDVHCKITEQVDLDEVLIPPLILQPYVENAIWHGLMHKTRPGTLSIEMMRVNGTLQCVIEDDGIGREAAMQLKSKSATRYKSMGMGITHDRIAIHNRMSELGISVKIEDKRNAEEAATGTRVIIDIPIKPGD